MAHRSINVSKPVANLRATICLEGSKSISNRALLIAALCGQTDGLSGLSQSNDTQRMTALLGQQTNEYDCGEAGTVARFITAWLAFRPGTQTLTGTPRMQQRPLAPLIAALRTLGANITCLENEGFLPIQFHAPTPTEVNSVSIAADVSSQFISALLMLGPTLPIGLHLILVGEIISRPYIAMTLGLMSHFGIEHTWSGDTIRIAHQTYQPRPYAIEADWSAASYWYGIAALTHGTVDLILQGIGSQSLQGDAAIVAMFAQLGIASEFGENTVRLTKSGEPITELFEQDFRNCPDVAQTLAVVCGGLGVQALFSGLETLPLKETDRIAAIQQELGKVGVFLSKLPTRFSSRKPKQYYMLEGSLTATAQPTEFDTYDDHRMAMSLAMLATRQQIRIQSPNVVRKSYPTFWEDMKIAGFTIADA